MKVYFSKTIETFLNDALRTVKNPVAYFLINKSVESNLSYMEVSEEDKVLVTPEVKIQKFYKETGGEASDFSSYAEKLSLDNASRGYTEIRVMIKMGRLIRKIIEDNRAYWDIYIKRWRSSYNENRTEDELIEELVIQYKGCTKRIFDKGYDTNIELVSGADIAKWYFDINYTSNKTSKSILHDSCMRYSRCQSYFDIYTKNPEVCSMLIFKDSHDKISMRALVWTLSDGRKYMDRIYSSNISDVAIFTNYAKRQNWLGYDFCKIDDMSVKLKNLEYEAYPYLDTFKYYDRVSFILNKKPKNNREIILSSPEGTYKTQ